MAASTQEALEKRIDLSQLVPSLKSCELVIQESVRPVLHAIHSTGSYSHDLTTGEMNRLSLILNDT
ncbi:glucosaminidase, partial [Parabacteroides merdae]|nr:glucosaminidase [Parabacteroides merdae]